jgi:hypothetical protein
MFYLRQFINNNNNNSVIINLVLWSSNTIAKIIILYHSFYDKPIIYSIKNGFDKIIGNVFTPKYLINITVMRKSDDDDDDDDDDDKSNNFYIIDETNYSLNNIHDYNMLLPKIPLYNTSHLITIKYNNMSCVHTKCRFLENNILENNILENNILENRPSKISNVDFLTVQYTHYKMDYTIDLVLPKYLFFCGNEILSNVFILKLLKQQSLYYVFDKHYNIQLIDSNISQINLTYNEYIILFKDHYNIIRSKQSLIYKGKQNIIKDDGLFCDYYEMQ